MIHQPEVENVANAVLKGTHLKADHKIHIIKPVTNSGTISVIHQPTAHTVMPRAIMVFSFRPSGGACRATQIPRMMERTDPARRMFLTRFPLFSAAISAMTLPLCKKWNGLGA